jgi:ubiquitin-conjugating enzyme E2 M
MEGHVCLNILREDWKPVLTINSVVYGLTFLMLEPNADDPLNKEAAQLLESNRPQFESMVRRSLRGGTMKVGSQMYTFPQLVRD